jgi:hypothetical protein
MRARKLTELFDALTTDDPNRIAVEWKLGQRPDDPPICIFADGIASEGSNASPPSLYAILEPIVAVADPTIHGACASYSLYGMEYSARQTSLDLLGGRPVRLIRPFFQTSPELQTTVIAFSQGCSFVTLGLSQIPDRLGCIRHVILIQPAFSVRREAVAEVAQFHKLIGGRLRIPLSPAQLMRPDFGLPRRIEDALEVIAKRTTVTVLYWPDDPFLAYDDWLPRFDRLSITYQVVSGRVPPTGKTPAPDDVEALDTALFGKFLRHLRVPRFNETKDEVSQIINPQRTNLG